VSELTITSPGKPTLVWSRDALDFQLRRQGYMKSSVDIWFQMLDERGSNYFVIKGVKVTVSLKPEAIAA
jgi:hypothetical protein